MEENNKTASDFLRNELNKKGFISLVNFYEAKEIEKNNRAEDLIGFQIYLNNKGLITNHEWDFEKLAKQYIKKEYK